MDERALKLAETTGKPLRTLNQIDGFVGCEQAPFIRADGYGRQSRAGLPVNSRGANIPFRHHLGDDRLRPVRGGAERYRPCGRDMSPCGWELRVEARRDEAV
jgi:hypothetical protein